MSKKKTFGIDDYINKDLKQLGKEEDTTSKKAPKLTMLRYMVTPRQFNQNFGENKPNLVQPVEEFNMNNDVYNMVYVLFNHDKEIWRMFTTMESQETVELIRDNKAGRVELICRENYHAIVRLKDDNKKIQELADFKRKYKQNIDVYHLELDFAQGVKKFVGQEIA
jgi:hypothetical protein